MLRLTSELEGTVLVAEKFLELSSARKRPRETSGVILSISKGMRTSEVSSLYSNPRTKDNEMRCHNSSKQVGSQKDKILLLQSLVLFRPSMDLVISTHSGQDNLLSLPIQVSSGAQREIMFTLGISW